MTLYYFDTSALVKLYVVEIGSRRIAQLFEPGEFHRFVILSVSQVELHTAVYRRVRDGEFNQQFAGHVFTTFADDLANRFEIQDVSDPVVDRAIWVADKHPLTGSDALQLGGCIFLQERVSPSPVFVCADRQLLQAARAEGLSCLNPME